MNWQGRRPDSRPSIKTPRFQTLLSGREQQVARKPALLHHAERARGALFGVVWLFWLRVGLLYVFLLLGAFPRPN
jgi:hypothetical protein